MSDRELLEMAAKAAGIDLYATWGEFGHFEGYRSGSITGDVWNPLTDDGDALRLAVKLHLTLRCYMGNTCAQATVPGGPNAYIDEMDMGSPYAATRRAIVRAAAEIGKTLP